MERTFFYQKHQPKVSSQRVCRLFSDLAEPRRTVLREIADERRVAGSEHGGQLSPFIPRSSLYVRRKR